MEIVQNKQPLSRNTPAISKCKGVFLRLSHKSQLGQLGLSINKSSTLVTHVTFLCYLKV